ncbi:MAG: SAM-dependent methyltransferase [Chloroflexota bacterium]
MAMLADTLEGIGATARWTAAARALERERPDPLLDDPWAARLAGADGMAWLARQAPGATLPMVLRARFFDDWLLSCVDGDRLAQVVLLGSGLETRAWRLAWPAGTVLFEIDRGPVLELKAAMLDEARALLGCRREAITADLAEGWPSMLFDAGFDPARPTAWLAEGVLFYLPDAVARDVLAAVSRLSAPGSRLGFDIPNRAVLTSPWTKAWIDMQAAAGAPWQAAMDDPTGELAPLGWAAAVSQLGLGASGHGRWTLPILPAAATELPHSWCVTATFEG